MAQIFNGGLSEVELVGNLVSGSEQVATVLRPGAAVAASILASMSNLRVRAPGGAGERPFALTGRRPLDVGLTDLRSDPSEGPALTVMVRNASPLPVRIYRVDSTGRPEPLGSLLPRRDAAAVPERVFQAQPGDVLRACAFGTNTILAEYGVSQASDGGRPFIVDVRPPAADVSATLRFTNHTTRALNLLWVDFDGEERQAKTVAPGAELFVQRTWLRTNWLVRDAEFNTLIDVISVAPDTSDIPFDGLSLRSMGGTLPARVELWNAAPFAVRALWVGSDGAVAGAPIDLAAGARRVVQTFVGHVWRFTRPEANDHLGVYVVGSSDRQRCTISGARSGQPGLPVMQMTNVTGTTVEVMRSIPGQLAKVVYARLVPGDQVDQPSEPGVEWVVRDARSGTKLDSYISGDEDVSHQLQARGVRQTASQRRTRVVFNNTTPFDVDVANVDFNGDEHLYATVRPGASLKVSGGYVSVPWRVREHRSQRILALFHATDDSDQVCNVHLRALHSRTPIRRRFENHSALTVEVVAFDGNGEPYVVATLVKDDWVEVDTFMTHPFVARDAYSGRAMAAVWGHETLTRLPIYDGDVRQLESAVSTTLRVRNQMPFDVEYSAVDFDGKETVHRIIKAGRQHAVVGWQTQPWRFRSCVDGSHVALVIPKDVSQQDVDLKLTALRDFGDPMDIADQRRRRQRDGSGWTLPPQCSLSTVRVRNASPLTIDVYWVDHEGVEHLAGTVENRDENTWETYSSYPWVARDRASGEVVGFTRAARTPTTLDVYSKTLRLQRQEFEFFVNVTNTVGAAVDLIPVDRSGNELFERAVRIEDDTSAEVLAFPSEPFRARFATNGQEMDLFIASAARRSITLVNRMVKEVTDEDRPLRKLWPGEVAVFTGTEFTGRCWLLYADMPNFTDVPGMNDQIKSLRVGPGTLVTAYRDVDFQGVTDIFPMDREALDGTDDSEPTDVGNAMSSVKITQLVNAEHIGITTTNQVSEDVRIDTEGAMARDDAGEPIKDTVYRTTLRFPQGVEQVAVRLFQDDTPRSAEEQEERLPLVIRVGGRVVDITETRTEVLPVNAAGQLVIQMESNRLVVPPLLVRTNLMSPTQEFLLFPAADALKRVSERSVESMEADLVAHGTLSYPEGNAGTEKKAAVQDALAAVKQLANAVPHRQTSHGSGSPGDRGLDLSVMDMAGFRLTMGSSGPSMSPIDANMDTSTYEEVSLEMGLFGDFMQGVGSGFKVVAKGGVSAGIGVAKVFASDADDAKLDTAERAADEAIDDTVDVIVEQATVVVEEAMQVATQVLEAIAEVGGKLVKVVIDTAEKVAAVITKVIEVIVESVKSFIAILKTLLEWDDIQTTAREFVGLVDGAYEYAEDTVVELRAALPRFVSELRRNKDEAFTHMRQALGLQEAPSTEDSDEGGAGGMDILSWVLDKISAVMGGRAALLEAILPSAMPDAVEALQTEVRGLLRSFVALVGQTLDATLGAFIDAMQGFIEALGAIAENPSDASQILMGTLLTVGSSVLDLALDTLNMALDFVLDVALTLLGGMNEVLDAELPVPLIREFFEWVSGDRTFCVKNIAALLFAIPMTVAGKLANDGERVSVVFEMPSWRLGEVLQQTTDTQNVSIVVSALHVLVAICDSIADIAAGNATALFRPGSNYAALARGVGLVLYIGLFAMGLTMAGLVGGGSAFDILGYISLVLVFVLIIVRFSRFFLDPSEDGGKKWIRRFGWVTTGVGVFGLVLAVVATIVKLTSDKPPQKASDRWKLATLFLLPIPAVAKGFVGSDNKIVAVAAVATRVTVRGAAVPAFVLAGAFA